MNTELFLQIIPIFVNKRVAELTQELSETYDFATFEQEILEMMSQVSTLLIAIVLTEIMTSPEYLAQLKQLAARKGMRFKEYRTVKVFLATGKTVECTTPYFVKAKPKRGRKKPGPNGRGSHLGFQVLGLIGRSSPVLVSEVVKMAVLCPSLAIAQDMLTDRGIHLDVSTISRFCRQLATDGIRFRGQVSLTEQENLQGHTLVIGIDGGRLRERCRKRGRKKKGQKQQGYNGEWREPKLFTMYLLDEQGEIVKSFKPVHDATMGNHEELFTLLNRYLSALPVAELSRLVFCGDGAPWIWSGVEALCRQLNLSECCSVYQVLDYTHAKQNLQDIIDLVSKKVQEKEKIAAKWQTLLWQGDIDALQAEISRVLTGRKETIALKKWRSYFEKNAHRMQYETFKTACIPCGSGCVESAIRRVINLRLKSAGTFWKRETAEHFLFLRSQLISGRWSIFLKNVIRQSARALLNLANCLDVELFQPALSKT